MVRVFSNPGRPPFFFHLYVIQLSWTGQNRTGLSPSPPYRTPSLLLLLLIHINLLPGGNGAGGNGGLALNFIFIPFIFSVFVPTLFPIVFHTHSRSRSHSHFCPRSHFHSSLLLHSLSPYHFLKSFPIPLLPFLALPSSSSSSSNHNQNPPLPSPPLPHLLPHHHHRQPHPTASLFLAPVSASPDAWTRLRSPCLRPGRGGEISLGDCLLGEGRLNPGLGTCEWVGRGWWWEWTWMRMRWLRSRDRGGGSKRLKRGGVRWRRRWRGWLSRCLGMSRRWIDLGPGVVGLGLGDAVAVVVPLWSGIDEEI